MPPRVPWKAIRRLASESLRKRGYEVDDQAIFNLTFVEIYEKLKRRIEACDAVVCLIGFAFGGEPSDRPPDQPRRSYTQWEYYFARELKKPVYLLVADETTPFDLYDASRKATNSGNSRFAIGPRSFATGTGLRLPAGATSGPKWPSCVSLGSCRGPSISLATCRSRASAPCSRDATNSSTSFRTRRTDQKDMHCACSNAYIDRPRDLGWACGKACVIDRIG